MNGVRTVPGLALLIASSWSVGTIALTRFRPTPLRPHEWLALRLLAGLGLTAVGLSLLAVTGNFSHANFLVGGLAVFGAIGTTITTRRDPGIANSVDGEPKPLGRVTAIVLFTAIALAVAGASSPVTDDDALAYVIPIARHIVDTGQLAVWPDQARSMWPMSQEVLLAYLLQVGGNRLGLLTAFEWLLCLGVVSALARCVCKRQDHALPALLIGFGAPVVAFQIPSAKEDLLVVGCAAAAALCVVKGRETADLFAAGVFAGIAAGAKYLGAAVPLALALWIVFERRPGWLRAASIITLSAAISGGLAYALNTWRFGNPVAPFVFGAPGTSIDAAIVRDFMNGYGGGKTAASFFLAPFHIFLEPGRFCGRGNLFNPVAYAGLAALWTSDARRRHRPLLFMAAVIYVVWFATLQNARFLWPAAVLLSPAAAEILVPFVRRSRVIFIVSIAAAIVCVGVVPAVGALRTVRYVSDPAGFLERETQNYSDIQWMNEHLDPAADRVGSDHKALAHLTIPWIFLDPTYQTEISSYELRNPELFLDACRRQGLTHLFGTANSFTPFRADLRVLKRNPSSRLGGTRFFREVPTEETVVFEIVYRDGVSGS